MTDDDFSMTATAKVPKARRGLIYGRIMAEADAKPCNVICGWCGELVHDGTVSDGHSLYLDHLQDEHPDKFKGVIAREIRKRNARRKLGVAA